MSRTWKERQHPQGEKGKSRNLAANHVGSHLRARLRLLPIIPGQRWESEETGAGLPAHEQVTKSCQAVISVWTWVKGGIHGTRPPPSVRGSMADLRRRGGGSEEATDAAPACRLRALRYRRRGVPMRELPAGGCSNIDWDDLVQYAGELGEKPAKKSSARPQIH